MINIYSENLEDIWFGVASKNKKIFSSSFGFSRKLVLKKLKNNYFASSAVYSVKRTDFGMFVLSLLMDIYSGKSVHINSHLVTDHLSKYAKNVLDVTSLIPIGYVTSYASIAKIVGGSPRAVGRVMAINPFPLLIPCHRVVYSDFKIGGYGLGLNFKFEILKRENRNYNFKCERILNDKVFNLYPVNFVFKNITKKVKS